MNPNFDEAQENINNAREALRRGDKETARDLAEKAVLMDANLVDAWLVLVAADRNPEDALAYAQKALELDPANPRSQKAVQWAMAQLQSAQAGNLNQVAQPAYDDIPPVPVQRPIKNQAKKSPPQKKSNKNMLLYAGIGVGLLLCVVIAVALWVVFGNPAQAQAANATPEVLWAQVNVPKPGVTPIDVSVFSVQATNVPTEAPVVNLQDTPLPTDTELPLAVPTETALPTDAPTSVPEATETPGVMAMEIVDDTPTSAYVPPTNAPVKPPVAVSSGGGGNRWIDVNLSTQSVYAYEGDTVVNSFIVSTGTWLTPTVTGQYKIWIKLRSAPMSGPGYYLPDVPYIMYFYKGYGLHGTYWHNNFGTPMSHGCVNLRTSDAEWLYNWASVGTVVNVHY